MDALTPYGKLFYTDTNANGKRPILLLHGLGSDGSSWVFQMEHLKDNGLRPITIDLPGFGKSTCSWQTWSLENCATASKSVMDALSIQQFDVAGISMGGVVAQFMAINYPERVGKIILMNTFACLRPQKLEEWGYLAKRYLMTMTRGKEEQAKMVAERLLPDPDQTQYREEIIRQITRADAHVYQKALRGLGLLDIRKRDMLIRSATLVMTAKNDTTVPVKNQIEMAKCIPGARQVFVPNSRHALIVDQPEMTNQIMTEFLAASSNQI